MQDIAEPYLDPTCWSPSLKLWTRASGKCEADGGHGKGAVFFGL